MLKHAAQYVRRAWGKQVNDVISEYEYSSHPADKTNAQISGYRYMYDQWREIKENRSTRGTEIV